MRKVYVLLGTCKATNHTWIVGVYSSWKKALNTLAITQILEDTKKFEIKTEVLI